MDLAGAKLFAREWVAAWNAHDIERILGHYDDDFEMSSPVIAKLMEESTGKLKGKNAARAYWTKSLATVPELRFELLVVLVGVNSVTIYYKGHRGLAAEVFHFGKSGRVSAAFAHYAQEQA